MFIHKDDLNAQSINIYQQQTTLLNDEIKLLYYSYMRESAFFFGNKKNFNFNEIGIRYTLKIKFTEINTDFNFGKLDIAGRKTIKDGFNARVGIARNIGGDKILSPEWKWGFYLGAGKYNLTRYLSSNIDISYEYLMSDLMLSVSKKIKLLSTYGGIRFFYSLNSIKENQTKEKNFFRQSGFAPFIGFMADFFMCTSLQFEKTFYNEKGFSAAFAVSY